MIYFVVLTRYYMEPTKLHVVFVGLSLFNASESDVKSWNGETILASAQSWHQHSGDKPRIALAIISQVFT